MDKNKKAIWGWAIYDWANSAFATTVMAGFFPIFFKSYWNHGVDVNISTARLADANFVAGLIIALLAPLLGAIADQAHSKKKLLITFAYLGVIMTGLLFTIGQGAWIFASVIYIIAILGFSGANIFYDALLTDISDKENVDVVSSLGYSLGYLGGGLLFLVNVLMTLHPEWFGILDQTHAVRYAFLSVALWWGGFSLFTIFWVPQAKRDGRRKTASAHQFIFCGFKQLAATMKKIRHHKTILLFLAAYWFYIDGVDTIIRMAVDYGMSIGFNPGDLIGALLLVQFVGFPAALLFGKLSQHWSVRKSIYLAIGCYMGITLWGAMITRKYEFYILACMIGLVQGGIQALSRSYFSRLIPHDQAAEYFGFYNMLGKFATILGPILMAYSGLLVKRMITPPNPTAAQLIETGQLASRWGIASVLLLFVVGALLFHFVDEAKGSAEVEKLIQTQVSS